MGGREGEEAMTLTPLQAARLRFALWAIFAVVGVGVFASSCRRVEDGRDAVCLGVTATHGLCLEWRARP